MLYSKYVNNVYIIGWIRSGSIMEQDEELNEFKELIRPRENKSFLNRVINFMGTKFKSDDKITKREISKSSKFDEFLKHINKKDPIYEVAEKVIGLCDLAIDRAKEKLIIESKLQVINAELKEIAHYDAMTDEEIAYFKELLERYMSLAKDRNALRYQIAGFDRALEKMEKLEDDAKEILDNVKDAERKQRYFKHDLMHLEGEREALQFERETLLNAKAFTIKFTKIVMILFGVAAVSLIAFGIISGTDVFIPLAILCVMMLILVPIVYFLNIRIKRELKINQKKRTRANELFNKKSVVYVHYTKFLNFIYKKYDVTGADKLDQNIKDFSNYKHLITRFDGIGNNLRRTEDQIEFFIKEHNIQHNSGTIEGFAKTLNIGDKKRYYNDLKREKERLEERNKTLEDTHNNIWNDLQLLNEEDKSSHVIDNIIQKYIEEVGKLVNTIKYEQPLPELEFEPEEIEKEVEQKFSLKKESKQNKHQDTFDFDVTAD